MAEITPLPTDRGTWTIVSRKKAVPTKTEITPLPTDRGTWTVLTEHPAGFRNLGLTRGARSVT